MEKTTMNPERYPWDRIGAGAEPELAPDFAARVMDRARAESRRAKLRRQVAAGAICGGLALGIAFFGIRRTRVAPPEIAATAPHTVALASAGAGESLGMPSISDIASAYGIATDDENAPDAYGDGTGAQEAAAQDQGDVFSTFLPGADNAADFATSYTTNADRGWPFDAGWDTNS
jgi:hypothetical protein